MLTTRAEAYGLLQRLGAPDRLIGHARYVSKAADSLMVTFGTLGVPLNTLTVELGATLHDAGKIHHPKELSAAGVVA